MNLIKKIKITTYKSLILLTFVHFYFLVKLYRPKEIPSNSIFSIFVFELILLVVISINIFIEMIGIPSLKRRTFSFIIIPIYVICLFFCQYISLPNKQFFKESTQEVEVKKDIIEKTIELKKEGLDQSEIEKEVVSTNPETKQLVSEIILYTNENPDATQSEVVEKKLRTVAVEQSKWNCNSSGCVYGDEEIIWTIEPQTRNLNIALSTMSLIMLIASFINISKDKLKQ